LIISTNQRSFEEILDLSAVVVPATPNTRLVILLDISIRRKARRPIKKAVKLVETEIEKRNPNQSIEPTLQGSVTANSTSSIRKRRKALEEISGNRQPRESAHRGSKKRKTNQTQSS